MLPFSASACELAPSTRTAGVLSAQVQASPSARTQVHAKDSAPASPSGSLDSDASSLTVWLPTMPPPPPRTATSGVDCTLKATEATPHRPSAVGAPT